MVVTPYKRPPAPPRVAVLSEEGVVVDEDGALLGSGDVEPGTRVFAQWDVARGLLKAGVGEALAWNNEEIRWRRETHPEEEDWISRPSDAYVLRLPLTDTLRPKQMLGALVRWRDWLASCAASPTGTTGSAAMSLLRSRLARPLYTGVGERPPLLQTRGGRMQVGPAGAGEYSGRLVLYDLSAAYARELAAVRYGGSWLHVERSGKPLGFWTQRDLPLYCRATVDVPSGLRYGPLLRSFRRRVHHSEMEVYSHTTYPDGSSWLYPLGRRLAGVWTWLELEAASEVGCRVQVRDAWVHVSDAQPFAAWWETVDSGREMGGLAGTLAKMTGNALWGRFCLDPRVAGRRTIRDGYSGRARDLRQNPFQWPAHDLAEHVSGRTRARLYRLMAWAGERLVSGNTDGAWLMDDGSEPPEGWRVKARAHRLQLLDPTHLRYWPERSRWPRTVYSGVPAGEAAEAFERAWARARL